MNRLWFAFCAVSTASIMVLSLSARAHQFGDDDFRDGGSGDKSLLVPDHEVQTDRGPRDYCQCIGANGSQTMAKIHEALRSRLKSTGLDFVDVPLEEVVALLQNDYDIPVLLDTPALDEIGLGPEQPVTIKLQNISLQSALRLMLKRLQLTYIIQDEVLVITSAKEAEESLQTCVYDVRDLAKDGRGKSMDALIDAIVSCVATETWAENGGGEAEIRPLSPGLLVVSQVAPIQEQIRDLLASVRAMSDLNSESAAKFLSASKQNVVTRSYLLQIDSGEKAEQLPAQLRSLITNSILDPGWSSGRLENGQPVVLAVFPDRIVVRHTLAVQNEVENLLRDTGIATPSDQPQAGGGGMGGGGIFQPKPNPAEGSYGMRQGRPGNRSSPRQEMAE
jgi:hypothetical protein